MLRIPKSRAGILKKHKFLLVLLAFGLVLRLMLSVQIYSGDVNNHVAWGRDSLDLGFPGINQREFMERYGALTPTYPPIPLFLFTISHGLYDWVYSTSWDLNLAIRLFPSNFIFFLEDQDTLPAFTKIWAIFADLGIAVVIYLFAKKLVKQRDSKWPLVTASFVLFNPAFFYNSAYWGQIEALPLFFVLVSFYLLLYFEETENYYPKRYIAVAILFTAAILIKQTSIVFIPLFALTYLSKFGIQKSMKGLLASLGAFWLAFLPFYKGSGLDRFLFPFLTYWNKIQTGSGSDYVTDHAFNFWALVSGLGKIPDSTPYLFGMPYRLWGYTIFFALTAVILYKLYKVNFDNLLVLFAATLIPFAAFLFLTRMHGRYLEQALPFLLLISVKNKKFLAIFVVISLFHFANLHHNWWAPRVKFVVDTLSQMSTINIIIAITLVAFSYLSVKYLMGTKS